MLKNIIIGYLIFTLLAWIPSYIRCIATSLQIKREEKTGNYPEWMK